MPKINGIQYPDTPADMARFKDKAIVALFDGMWRSQRTTNDVAFLNLAGKAKGAKAYDAFERTGLHSGKCTVTLSKAHQSKITGMLSRGDPNATDVKKMQKIVQLAADMVEESIKAVALSKFYASPAFQKQHRKAVFDSIKINKKLAAKLELEKPADIKRFFFHVKMGENQAAEQVLTTAAKAQALKAKAPQVVKTLMRQNNL